jgi:hypothetical protein
MGRIAKAVDSLAAATLWIQCTVMVNMRTEGWFWIVGRRARERAFIRRLLVEYPGLFEQPKVRLNRVADRALGSLTRWPSRIATFAAMGIAGFAAKVTWGYLLAWGAPLPPWTRPPAVAAGAILVGDAVRRTYIRRDVTHAIASLYPGVFCPCGYCLLGLPDDITRCPECGTQRDAAPVTSGPDPAAAAGAATAAGGC